MLVFFTEDDLLSFGEYMVSDARRKKIEDHPDVKEDEVDNVLKTVHRADLVSWLQETQANTIIE